MDVDFQYNTVRAEEARIGAQLTKLWRAALATLTVVLALLGMTLLFIGDPLGWLVVGVAAIPAMIVEWWNGKLRDLPVTKNPKNVTDIISGDILAQLPKAPTPQDIARAVGRVPGGQFFGARFGVTASFLQDIASKDAAKTADVWNEAQKVMKESGSDGVSGGCLAVALVRCFPESDTLLAHLHLDDNDLIRGLKWQNHLKDLIAQHSQPRRTGGIARDFSFGYIPLLKRFGQNISEQIGRGGLLTVELEAHTEALNQLIESFGAGAKQNAVLVGPAGVGKTTLVHSLAERLLDATAKIPDALKFRQVFILDASSLIAAAPKRGELENLIMQVLGEAYSAKNIIICLDNAQLFFEEGIGSVDLTNVLLPILEAGNLRIILTMDEQRFLEIGRRNPALTNALNRISMTSANKDETIAVMQDQLIVTGST
ncbi:MAG: AAA family ATPase [Candidatus Saccharibacteria bacterium]